jgi:spore coat polysaccharide biosynthesis predicted glycosyltransferase SpsG
MHPRSREHAPPGVPDAPLPARVAILLDESSAAGPDRSTRQAALSEVLSRHGVAVTAVVPRGVVGSGPDRLRAAGAEVVRVARLTSGLDLLETSRPDAVVVDTARSIDPARLAALDARTPVLAVTDGGGTFPVSAVTTTHPRAEDLAWLLRPWTRLLCGPSYVPIRGAVRARRDAARRRGQPRRVGRVLVATDVMGVGEAGNGARWTARLCRAVLRTGERVTVRAVTADAATAAAVRRSPQAAGQHTEVVPAGGELAEQLAWADVVVTTAGTTLWDACHLGRAVVAVSVGDGREPVCRWVDDHDVALATTPGSAPDDLADLFADAGLRERFASAAAAVIDGDGAERLAAQLAALTRAGVCAG